MTSEDMREALAEYLDGLGHHAEPFDHRSELGNVYPALSVESADATSFVEVAVRADGTLFDCETGRPVILRGFNA